jgi:hypothetical protein
VGILGKGNNGAGGIFVNRSPGSGGSGGTAGSANLTQGGSANTGGRFGGGGGGQSNDSRTTPGCNGGGGAVRIVWGVANVFAEPVTYATIAAAGGLIYTSLQYSPLINLAENLNNLTFINTLSPNQLNRFNVATSASVLLEVRTIISLDFASRTSFNSSELLKFDPPQYWIGA